MADRVHVFIEGQVQGCGFRYAIQEQANAHGVTGWVRNLPDGRVEAEFEGAKAALEQMVEYCKEGPNLALVTHVASQYESGAPLHKEFRVRG